MACFRHAFFNTTLTSSGFFISITGILYCLSIMTATCDTMSVCDSRKSGLKRQHVTTFTDTLTRYPLPAPAAIKQHRDQLLTGAATRLIESASASIRSDCQSITCHRPAHLSLITVNDGEEHWPRASGETRPRFTGDRASQPGRIAERKHYLTSSCFINNTLR